MKNGVLYIIDDNDNAGGTGPGGDGAGDEVESAEEDMEYAASDLAVDGQLREQSIDKGFFSTPWGYAAIIAIAVVILLLLLFFLFFGVIVFGEIEEHDEVFELCAIRLMLRRDGGWYVNLGSAFDDNAVLRLNIGLLFAVMFDGWDVTGKTSGMYEGEVTGQIRQGMLLYRKSIRRSV